MYKKSFFITFSLVISCFCSFFAQIPTGYYNDASGKSGRQLQVALSGIIDSHRVVSYPSLWTYFGQTDLKPNGKIWDIYADGGSYELSFPTDQCINTGGYEGVCYNREHSFCQSWFGNSTGSPYSDLFHIYPVDGYINSLRNNNPYGTIQNPSRTFTNGSKFGTNTYPGAPVTNSFEPIDEYKGDIARSFFYIATRYMFEDQNYTDHEMNIKSQLKPWALEMLKSWHTLDPVSQKEIDRNNAIYSIQRNRNPYIDYPELVGIVFGSDSISPFIYPVVPVPDLPEVKYFSVKDNSTLQLAFDIPILSATAENISNYVINGGLTVRNAVFTNDTVTITFNNPMGQGIQYSLTVKNIESTDFYFNKDTSIAFTYGTPIEHTAIVAWTFDNLLSKPETPTTMQPEINLITGLPAFIYCDGTHESSTFVSSSSNTNEINAYTGTIEGDPRGAGASAGKALTIENLSANGKSMVFHFPTKGWKNIIVTFACQKTSTGFNRHDWEWSTDGETYTALSNINTVPDVSSAFKVQTIDLQSLDTLENEDSVFLRITLTGATGATGNNRFDNIVVKGIAYNTGIQEPQPEDFTIFPNPVTGYFEVQITNPKLQVSEIQVLDMNGRLLMREKFEGKNVSFNMQSYPAGSYLISLKTKSGQKIKAKKIIVTR